VQRSRKHLVCVFHTLSCGISVFFFHSTVRFFLHFLCFSPFLRHIFMLSVFFPLHSHFLYIFCCFFPFLRHFFTFSVFFFLSFRRCVSTSSRTTDATSPLSAATCPTSSVATATTRRFTAIQHPICPSTTSTTRTSYRRSSGRPSSPGIPRTQSAGLPLTESSSDSLWTVHMSIN